LPLYTRRQSFEQTANEQSTIRTVSTGQVQKDTEELEATQEQLILIPKPQLLQHQPSQMARKPVGARPQIPQILGHAGPDAIK